MFWAEIWIHIRIFLSENFQFLTVKFSVYLNRRVFGMDRIRAVTREHVPSDMCTQGRLKTASLSAQSDQPSLSTWRNLHPWLSKVRQVKILIILRECASCSESSLGSQCSKVRFQTLRLMPCEYVSLMDHLAIGNQRRPIPACTSIQSVHGIDTLYRIIGPTRGGPDKTARMCRLTRLVTYCSYMTQKDLLPFPFVTHRLSFTVQNKDTMFTTWSEDKCELIDPYTVCEVSDQFSSSSLINTFTALEVLSEPSQCSLHYENTPIKIYRKFHHPKLKVFRY